jgi:hypothetical protein
LGPPQCGVFCELSQSKATSTALDMAQQYY